MIEKKFAKKGRFRFQECCLFPKDVDEFIRETIQRLQQPEKSFCHVFCGKSQIGGLRIDIDPDVKPDVVADCLDLSDKLGINSQKNILADLPWQIGYHKRRYFSYAMRDICKEGGYLILNCPWNPWVKGLKILEIWKVYQAFNSYRDLVDIWILQKETGRQGLTV